MKFPKYSGKPKKSRHIIVRRVSGDSMLPALRSGRLVVAVSGSGNSCPGQVVIIRHGGLEKVKRIQKIQQNQIFVVGDNQERSTDSRSFGWLHRSVVVGRVIWPKC